MTQQFPRSLLKYEQDEFYTVLQQAVTQQYRTAASPPHEDSLFTPWQMDLFHHFVQNARIENSSFSDQLAACTHALQELPVMTVTLAFDPTDQYLHEMIDRLTEYTTQPFVLIYRVDTSIMAGIQCEYNGKIANYSLIESFVSSFPDDL